MMKFVSIFAGAIATASALRVGADVAVDTAAPAVDTAEATRAANFAVEEKNNKCFEFILIILNF